MFTRSRYMNSKISLKTNKKKYSKLRKKLLITIKIRFMTHTLLTSISNKNNNNNNPGNMLNFIVLI